MTDGETVVLVDPWPSRLKYGGGGHPDDDRPDFARTGYTHGVPMGGDLRQAPDSAAPTFMIRALRDPDGANLDRVQIVKGWLEADGSLGEQVYDVVWSGDREPGADGKLPPVGNTVDLEAANWTNTIGASELATVRIVDVEQFCSWSSCKISSSSNALTAIGLSSYFSVGMRNIICMMFST